MSNKIKEVQAGRELDVLVAEKVMGWKKVGQSDHRKPLHKPSLDQPGTTFDDWDAKGPHPRLIGPSGQCHFLCDCPCGDHVPHYSTDISAAWEVVKELCKKLNRSVIVELGWRGDPEAMCSIGMHYRGHWLQEWRGVAGENDAPLAICRAALATIEKEKSRETT